jgi:hypothetical protein
MTANAKAQSKENLGIHIMIAGMAFQICSLLLFMFLWAEFELRVRAGAASRGEETLGAQSGFGKLRRSFKFEAFQIGKFPAREIYKQNSPHAVSCIY